MGQLLANWQFIFFIKIIIFWFFFIFISVNQVLLAQETRKDSLSTNKKSEKQNNNQGLQNLDSLFTFQRLIKKGDDILKKGDFKEALSQYQKTLNFAQKMKSKQLIANVYQKLANTAEKEMRNLDSALFYYKQFKTYNDSIYLEEKAKQQAFIRNIKELEKKNIEIEKLKVIQQERDAHIEEQKKIQFQQIRNQNILLIAIVLTLLSVIFLYRSNLQKQKTNNEIRSQKEEILKHQVEIERKNKMLSLQNYEITLQNNNFADINKDITDSIEYAQRIQSAMLPTSERIKQSFPEHFILFMPKDVVSGDFYWFGEVYPKTKKLDNLAKDRRTLTKQKNPQLIIAAIDCTGHGVPGAFMSLIGNELLNDIINKRGIVDPALVLQELHKSIRLALNQEVTDNKDGMDMALCMIDKEKKLLHFAGAYNPVILVQNNKTHVLKGDNNPVGGWHSQGEERSFKTQTVPIQNNDIIYLYSDGYQDQFGGENGKKLMKSHFKDLLFSVHHESMDKQKQLLQDFIEKWMIGHRQVDDIMVIGVKLILDETMSEMNN